MKQPGADVATPKNPLSWRARRKMRIEEARQYFAEQRKLVGRPPMFKASTLWWAGTFHLAWLIGFFATVAIARGVIRNVHRLDSLLESHSMLWPLFLGSCAVGVALYLLRKRWRFWYGYLEVSFAVAVMFQAAEAVTVSGTVEGLKLLAAVYVLIRGIDNCATGRAETERRLDAKDASLAPVDVS